MNLAIYGTGGSGKEVWEVLMECPSQRAKWDEIIFIDDTQKRGSFRGCIMLPYNAFLREYGPSDTKAIIAVGEPKNRKLLFTKIKEDGYIPASIIHEGAKISSSATICGGAFIQDGVIISSDAYISENVCINHRAMIGHDVKVNAHSQISAGVMISGHTEIGEASFIGGGACIRDHISIGEHSIISMGAVVLRDVTPYKIVIGNPARVIRENLDEKVF